MSYFPNNLQAVCDRLGRALTGDLTKRDVQQLISDLKWEFQRLDNRLRTLEESNPNPISVNHSTFRFNRISTLHTFPDNSKSKTTVQDPDDIRCNKEQEVYQQEGYEKEAYHFTPLSPRPRPALRQSLSLSSLRHNVNGPHPTDLGSSSPCDVVHE